MRTKAQLDITCKLVELATAGTEWDIGNKVLYDLCKKYPNHQQIDQVVAKIWLIGRTYAAAIERRRLKTAFRGDAFYTEYVAPKLVEWGTDRWLSGLATHREVTTENLDEILSCHWQLTQAFYRLTRLDKRSLASKYLHFHRPPLFFIYDTRADQALSALSVRHSGTKRSDNDADQIYQLFCLKCLALRDQVKATYGVRLTPRELDNLLLEVSRTSSTQSSSSRKLSA
jgi:hypothetical protein